MDSSQFSLMKHHLLTLLLLLIPVSLVAGRCQENQQSLLLQLKHGLNFSRSFSQKLVEWNASTECCEWPGIRCDSGGLGRVIGLNLSYESITGGGGLDNSVALFNLQYLKVLDLSFNHFNTTVPAALANLTNLRYLNLSAGSFFGQVPASISRMTSLVGLDLSSQDYYSYSGFAPQLKLEKPNLALLVRNLTQLTDLRLDGVNLSAQGKEWCQALSSSLRNLKVLSMSRCNLSGPIDPSLSKLKSLSIVELKENNFSSPFPDSFAELRNLTSLSLMSCELIGKFPAKILQIPTLELLDLSKNIMLQGVLPNFQQNHSMKTLKLSETSFNGVLPPSIGNLENLSWIDISKSNFIGTIPKTLGSLTQLEHLGFSFNNFTGPIPRFIFELESLEALYLSSNRFSGNIQLSWTQKLQNLKFLDLSYNNLTVDTSGNSSIFPQLEVLVLTSCNLRTFPDLDNQSRLAWLDLSDNNINGVVPRWIPESTSLIYLNISCNNLVSLHVQPTSLPFLQYLDMHHNQLQGEVSNILALTLSYVDCSHNRFNGSLPAEVIDNHPLGYLSLSNNSLTGPIPTSICNFSNLEVLDLSDNNLNDRIPDCLIENTKTLLVLDLSGNKLSGDIPNIFQASCSLETLDLNNNQFQGRVPKSLESCTALQVLDLGNNKISDVFPCLGRINSSLRVLILRNNLFHGSVWCPHDLHSTWQNLQIVDLAFNNFHGPLNAQFLTTWEAMMRADGNEMNNHLRHGPVLIRDSYYEDSITLSNKGLQTEYVKILKVFKSIDFSSNNFDGTIPQVMGKFTALQILNLSHNAFTSQIPSVLGNLSNLESLDLSNNRLNGRIPKELADMSFLAVLNLSDNNLNGSIPIGSQFQTFDNTSFGGNRNLCGQPLSKSCFAPPAPPKIIVGESTTSINWDLLSKAFGFIFGLGVVMLPAALWPSFRVWYWPKIDYLLIWMFPKIYVKDWNNRLRTSRRQQRRSKQTMTSSQQNHSPAISYP
ncbi:Receptor-like protein 7 [Linum perenne]